MKHKCDGCQYKGEHQEMMFRPVGVCTKENNLAQAEAAFNAKVCPHNETLKMTETEIMTELQSAAEWFAEHGKNTNTAIIGICERAIDFINRKNAEIDRLTEIEESHREQNGELRKEVERLTINMNAFGLGMKRESERAETARAEAIKEFAERVNELFPCDKNHTAISRFTIRQIAKEMGVE